MMTLFSKRSLAMFGRPRRPGESGFLVVLLLMLVIVATTGCSTFNRDWKTAAATPAPVNDLTGRWQGTWVSEVNGHTDKLRCLVSRQSETNYTARFHAKYQKIFSFGYTVNLAVKNSDGNFQFQGEANLGKLAGGVYHYAGHASATNFFSTYHCKYDHGTFRMNRPE